MNHIVGERGIQRVDIVRNTAQNITGRIVVKVADRKFHQVIEGVFSQCICDFSGQMDHGYVHNIAHDRAGHIEHQKQSCIFINKRKVHCAGFTAVTDQVDRSTGKLRSGQSQKVAGQRQSQNGKKLNFMLQQIAKDSD